MVAAGRVGAAVQIVLDGRQAGALAGAHVRRQAGGVAVPLVAVQLAPLPGAAVAAQAAFQLGHAGGQAAGEDRRLVFLRRRAHVVPERAVDAAEQVVGLRRVAELGDLHQALPGGTVFRAQFVEEGLPRAFLEEHRVQRGVGRLRRKAAVEGLQAFERFLRALAIAIRQGSDGLRQRLGHARILEHRLELGGERRLLVVLHGDHAARIVARAGADQFGDALGALGVEPGVGQLHAVAAGYGALVGGAQPALRRVLVVGMEHGVGVAVPAVLAVPAGRGHEAAAAPAVRVAAGDLPGDVLGVGIHHVQAEGADVAHRLVGLVHRLRARQVEEGV